MPTRNISLTPEQDDFIDEKLKKGEYRNTSEAVRDGSRSARLPMAARPLAAGPNASATAHPILAALVGPGGSPARDYQRGPPCKRSRYDRRSQSHLVIHRAIRDRSKEWRLTPQRLRQRRDGPVLPTSDVLEGLLLSGPRWPGGRPKDRCFVAIAAGHAWCQIKPLFQNEMTVK
jgi:hypothetical protein